MSAEHRIQTTALSIDDFVELLKKSGSSEINRMLILKYIANGAPQNPDGTLNLIIFTAWLAKEYTHGN